MNRNSARPIRSFQLRNLLLLPLFAAVVLIGQFIGIPTGVAALLALLGWTACAWLLSLRFMKQ